MRVITGIARGHRLIAPEGLETRPTSDKVKEGVFSSIQFELEGADVLDLFAGSGQMGIEALSRGAESCVFIDRDRKAVSLVKENLEACALRGSVLQADALGYLRGGEKFDLIFIDPPYDSGLYAPVLETINLVDNLSDGGIIICETRKEIELPQMRLPYRKVREYRYGTVKLGKYTKEKTL